MPFTVTTVALLVLVVLAAVSAFFSGMETALFSIKGWNLHRWRNKHPSAVEGYERLMKDPQEILNVLFLVDTFVNILLIVLTLAIVRFIEVPLPDWLKAIFLFGLIVLVCDLLPKALALINPFVFARLAVTSLRIIVPAVLPVSRCSQLFSEAIAGFLFSGNPDRPDRFGDEELIALVELSAEQGQLRADELELIAEIIKLGNESVKDCMAPRVDAFFLSDSLTNQEIIQELRIKRQARVPVFGESPDEILGILDVKSFLANPSESYAEQLDAPSFVPETMPALDLLRAFLKHPQRLAIVVDEFGGTEGVVTLNDIVDEILGDLAPRGDEGLYLEDLGDGSWLASGSVRLDDLAEVLDFERPNGEVDTLNGLIFNQLGYLPRSGDTVQIPPLEIQVRQSTRRRVVEAIVRNSEPPGAGKAA
ncbi:MAG: HlyC/CorC family transporter [Verrucomicrobia bacterium]|nr:HlyC/CorC family transporter [Verrucomicrobiota bacterium]